MQDGNPRRLPLSPPPSPHVMNLNSFHLGLRHAGAGVLQAKLGLAIRRAAGCHAPQDDARKIAEAG
jgi:hypothetical protein